ncbi:glycosyltransferase family 2 protein, partial [Ilumatobacter sp.]|uniref:glycosyltransferase family 2 protein n=1 Tax=Ilumatobacter sp. TaxID=1967498 RepID=UPI0037507C9C
MLHIESVIGRIPRDLQPEFDPTIVIIDDASSDATATVASRALEASDLTYPWEVLANPLNLGYGGNQKLGYRYAIAHGMDVVVMIHGDGQYPPEATAAIARAALGAGAAFGSRFGKSNGARAGGMPRYKYVGNQLLTRLQNRLLSTDLTEFHSGFRAYSVNTLRQIPFDLCANDFHFDTEIFIQCIRLGIDIAEFSIPTRYGDEVCHVNGIRYARAVVGQSVKSKLQEFGLSYERKYDIHPPDDPYESKIGFDSPSESALDAVPDGSRVVDFGS